MFGLKKKIQLSICQSGCRETRNSLSPMGDKDKDLGAVSQTVLTGVRLCLRGRLKQGLICRTTNGGRAPRERYLDIWGRKQSQSSSISDGPTVRRSVKTSLIVK